MPEGEQLSLEVGERQPQGIPSLDVWMMERINQAKQQLGEGERIDPWFVSDLFLTYHELVTAKMMQVHVVDRASTLFKTQTPEEREFTRSIFRTRDAYDIVAYPYYNVGQQKIISEDVYEADPPQSQEPFTLTSREKGTLQKITSAIGIPDNPQQVTYSFSAIPPAPKVVEGSID